MEAIFVPLLAILVGFALLIWSADRFVDGAADLAKHFGVSPLVVGMVIMGFGTSAPEMLVSGVAAWNGNPGMGIGNAIGSNITNITLVLGFTAIFYTLPVESRIIRTELPMLLGISVIATVLVSAGDYFGIFDGIVLLLLLLMVLTWMLYTAGHAPPSEPLIDEIKESYKDDETPYTKATLWWTIGGLLLLLLSSHILVWGGSKIALALGVSDLVIGLTIVAIGTSLPEVAATLSSAKKNEADLAVGNIVGSNFFNTLAVLALPALISPMQVDTNAVHRDLPIMLLLTLLLLVFARGCWKKHRNIINRRKGIVLFTAFIGYQLLLYYYSVTKIECTTWFCL